MQTHREKNTILRLGTYHVRIFFPPTNYSISWRGSWACARRPQLMTAKFGRLKLMWCGGGVVVVNPSSLWGMGNATMTRQPPNIPPYLTTQHRVFAFERQSVITFGTFPARSPTANPTPKVGHLPLIYDALHTQSEIMIIIMYIFY